MQKKEQRAALQSINLELSVSRVKKILICSPTNIWSFSTSVSTLTIIAEEYFEENYTSSDSISLNEGHWVSKIFRHEFQKIGQQS